MENKKKSFFKFFISFVVFIFLTSHVFSQNPISLNDSVAIMSVMSFQKKLGIMEILILLCKDT